MSTDALNVELTEREFLIKLAVDRYNLQYGKNFNYEDFDIFSILPSYSFDLGYEVYTMFDADNVRLRIYFRFSTVTNLTAYRVEVDLTYKVDILGDEVIVSIGEIDRWYKDSGQYTFGWLIPDPSRRPILLLENKDWFLLEDNNYINLEYYSG